MSQPLRQPPVAPVSPAAIVVALLKVCADPEAEEMGLLAVAAGTGKWDGGWARPPACC